MARFSHNPSMVDLPIACSLSPAALKARRENLLNVLWDRADERYELSNTIAFGFRCTVTFLTLSRGPSMRNASAGDFCASPLRLNLQTVELFST